ncbi:Crp/Fnr family transcriptional regulator [Thalassotalea sp. 1_MG-2023]|uniref:Crp/Fnr family transcriptional regulator n=1 Tax=Thalassotalea sp. 1_MG-2023 TaxID=3062680 RepID=UPI0026E1AA07|nr:Crp/Fnr family transcriptional regulator [Thalassotalea sp. 1_MG-2023]MDO6428802.1 Crp/Fnr family transcriptional regulator [Thalassotalea sp. 1_MG-2023]
MLTKSLAFQQLLQVMNTYYPISEQTWQCFQKFCQFHEVKANSIIYPLAEIPSSFSFIYQGLMRGYSIDNKGNEYNKIFFTEDMFPGSMTSLLTDTPAVLAIETIEDSFYISIDFAKFRQFLIKNEEIKLFHIHYLEKNWVLAKDAREIELVQQDATTRYKSFVNHFPQLNQRLPQYHVASHLGITPTQLSRIRKNLNR